MRVQLMALTWFLAVLNAQAGVDRFIHKIKLPAGLTAVVADGDWEARSTGSFSVRLYSRENAQSADDTTFFVCGIITGRDGSIEKVDLADMDGDASPEIIVTVRNAGTGQYLSAHAFGFDKKRVWLLASVAGLAKDADPIGALKKVTLNRKEVPFRLEQKN